MKKAVSLFYVTGLLLLVISCRNETATPPANTIQLEETQRIDTSITDTVPATCQIDVRRPDVSVRVRKGNALYIETEGLQLAAVDSAVKHAGVYSVTSLMEEELPPLPQGMMNMTSAAAGYRLLPGGEHFSPYAELRVSYDPSRLPPGYTPDDIYTSYYDTVSLAWVRLHRVEVDTFNHEIVSWTTHFTDFVNELLKAPVMPETQAFVPTAMTDLEAVNPLDGLPLVQPPAANNHGTATLSYPIDIPAGRGGMQPNLALTYSSAGGSGWIGVGWDLNVPSITLDTRWGVPRYDATYETEIYLLNGEQLVTKEPDGTPRPMPHRTNSPLPRTALGNDVRFHARFGDAHDSITRHGDSPRNYWWEVVDRNGVTHYYGHYLNVSRMAMPAKLTDDRGNIARWMLCESRDLYGNAVRYYYATDTVAGGRQIYLDSISYTGHDSIDGHYKLVFCRARTANTDIPVTCNNGFKEITAQTLMNIRLKYDDTITTAWLLEKEYGYRSNYRNRLAAITKIDEANEGMGLFLAEFCPCLGRGENPSALPYYGDTIVAGGKEISLAEWGSKDSYDSLTVMRRLAKSAQDLQMPYAGTTTQFEYYDAPYPDCLFDSSPTTSTLGSQELKGRLKLDLPSVNTATALGLSHSSSWHAGGTLAAGYKFDVWNTTLSAGGNYTYNQSSSESLMTLVDLDGDGLADKVFVGRDSLYFCRRIDGGDGIIEFDKKRGIQGARHFLCENSYSNALGVQISLVLIGGDASWPKSTSETTTFFADVNGDGLPDIVDDGRVLFNSLTSDGIPSFTPYEAQIPEPGSGNEEAAYTVMTSTSDCGGIIFDGKVNDSISCRIVWRFFKKYDTKEFDESIEDTVSKYEALGYSTYLDSTGLLNIYSPEWDCSPLGDGLPQTEMVRVWVAPSSGPVNIISTATLIRDTTEARRAARHTDGVSLVVQRNHTIPTLNTIVSSLLDTHYVCDTCYGTYTFQRAMTVSAGDVFFFRLRSRNDRQFDDIITRQQIVYATSPLDTFDSKRDFVLTSDRYFQAPANGRIIVSGHFYDPDNAFRWKISTMSEYRTNSIINDSTNVTAGQKIQCVVEKRNILPNRWGNMRCQPYLKFVPTGGGGDTLPDTIQLFLPVKMMVDSTSNPLYRRLFGPLHRGWGQFAYHPLHSGGNDNIIRFNRLTPPDMIVPGADNSTIASSVSATLDTTAYDTSSFRTSSTLSEFPDDHFYNPLSSNSCWVEALPDFEHWRWVGYGDVGNIGRDTMGNTLYKRMEIASPDDNDGIPPLPVTAVHDDPVPAAPSGCRTMAVRKVNTGNSHNYSIDFTIAGISHSNGSNVIVTDYLDLNGDRYPDILGPSNVQYSTPWGGLGTMRFFPYLLRDGTGSRTDSEGHSLCASSNFPQRTVSSSQGDAKFTLQGDGKLSTDGNIGHDTADATWLDINGDGLLDYVTGNGRVLLNTGYSFRDDGDWYVRNIHSGASGSSSFNAGAGLTGHAISIWQGSIQGGAGISYSANQNTVSLLDINGDGLPDRLWRCYDKHTLYENMNYKTRVSFNLGNGRWSVPLMLDVCRFNYSTSFNESVNLGGTLGATFGGFKATFGLRGSPYSGSVNRDRVQLVDINADGLPDLVSSDKESEISVRYNRGGRTNLLHTVTNFTGSRIHLGYTLSSPCYGQPSRSWLLTEVSTKDPLNPVGGDTSVTRFSYENPHYDRYERTSYGFEKVIASQINPSNNSVYRTIERDYHNNNILKRGKMKREFTKAGTNTPCIEKLFGFTYYRSSTDTVDPCQPIIFSSHEVTRTRYYEGHSQPQLTTEEEFVYDRYHNIVRYHDFGDTSRNDDGVTVEFTYLANRPNNLIGLRSGYIITPNGSSSVLRRDSYYYNDKGKLTAQTLYGNSDSSVYNFNYDSVYGNMSESILPRNDSNQRMVYRYTYDTVVHAYPTRITNSFEDSTRTTYDYRYGKPKTVTDPGGNTMAYEYDFAGRLFSVRSPMNTGPMPSLMNQYHTVGYYHNGFSSPGYIYNVSPTSHPYSISTHFDDNGTDTVTQTVVIADGFGRVLQTKKGLRESGVNKRQVSGCAVSDPFGRTVRQYDPVTEPLSLHAGRYNPDTVSSSRTATSYDILDRVTQIRQPMNTITHTSYRIDNDQSGHRCFVSAVTNPNGDSTVTYTDYDGRRRQVTDALGGITSFRYDTLGQLTRSTDPEGFHTNYWYDKLGRLVRRNHPDAGITEYTYDPAGNLTSESNGLGQIDYRYRFNRLAWKCYSGIVENQVKYLYGTTGNARGRLFKIVDGTGERTMQYDALGNVTREERIIAIPGLQDMYPFVTQYSYDSWGRVRTITYPDNEVVTYIYAYGGDLCAMYGDKGSEHHKYIDTILYNEFGQRSRIKYGNGTYSNYSYDALHRLGDLTSGCTLGTPGTMQQIHYTYDPVGNISLVNNGAVALSGLGGMYANSHSYDKLNRLIVSNDDQQRYFLTLRYTSSGRIIQKSVFSNATFHTFDSAFYGYCEYFKPHAPKRIFEKNSSTLNDLLWDASGNLGQVNTYSRGCPIGNRFLFWTEDNRLHTVVDEEYFSYYSYDHAGERTLKLTGRSDLMDINALLVSSNALLTEYTVYPSPYMVLSNRGYTKHYYIGADHLCARIGGGGLAGAEYNPRIENRATQLFNSCISSCEERVLNGNIEACIHGFGREEENLHIRETPLPRLRASAVPQPLETFAPRMAWYASHQDPETEVYFYHGDHLGGANWITDASGAPVQHLQYLPFGQPFVDRRVAGSSYSERYTFTGKERDEETGYGYFGARYMDHELMTMWLSVDPMADKYPSISPYAYCAWNPVKLVDPDGRDVWEINEGGELIWKERSATDKIISSNGSFVNVKSGVLRRGTDNEPGLSYTKEELGHFRLNFGDDSKNATEVFEFLADNANVEFSLLGLAKDPSDENANLFMITTSFGEGGDINGSIFAMLASLDNKMRSHSHNHPGDNALIVPSSILNNGILLTTFAGLDRGDDQGVAGFIQQGSPSCTFNIYHSSKGGEYRPYAQNTPGIHDYKYVPSMVNKKGGQYVFAQ